jgi:hypothetical protein
MQRRAGVERIGSASSRLSNLFFEICSAGRLPRGFTVLRGLRPDDCIVKLLQSGLIKCSDMISPLTAKLENFKVDPEKLRVSMELSL